MLIKRKYFYLFVAVSLLLSIQPALAENPDPNDSPWEKFSLDLWTANGFCNYPKWFLRSNFEIFYLEIKEFTGTIYESGVAIEYLLWQHLKFGLGFNTFDLDIKADGEVYPGIDFKGELEFK